MESSVPSATVAKTISTSSELPGDHDLNKDTSNSMGPEKRRVLPMEWTDEKHSLYLKSMEASFVNQLHKSLDLLALRLARDCSSGPGSSKDIPASKSVHSGQYKILRDGCWSRVNFTRDEYPSNKEDGSHIVMQNPWIRHFRSGCGNQTATSSRPSKKVASSSKQGPVSHSPCYQDSIQEVTDQNFVDEDRERELLEKDVESNKSSKLCGTKRMKTSAVVMPCSDQIVPFGKYPTTKDVSQSCVSPTE